MTNLTLIKEKENPKVTLGIFFSTNWRDIAYEWKLFKNSYPETKDLSNQDYKVYLNNIKVKSFLRTYQEKGYRARFFSLSNYLKDNQSASCNLQFITLSSVTYANFHFHQAHSRLNKTIFNYPEKKTRCLKKSFYALDRALLISMYHPKLKPYLEDNLNIKQLKKIRQILSKLIIEYLDKNNYTQQVILSNQHLLKE